MGFEQEFVELAVVLGQHSESHCLPCFCCRAYGTLLMFVLLAPTHSSLMPLIVRGGQAEAPLTFWGGIIWRGGKYVPLVVRLSAYCWRSLALLGLQSPWISFGD